MPYYNIIPLCILSTSSQMRSHKQASKAHTNRTRFGKRDDIFQFLKTNKYNCFCYYISLSFKAPEDLNSSIREVQFIQWIMSSRLYLLFQLHLTPLKSYVQTRPKIEARHRNLPRISFSRTISKAAYTTKPLTKERLKNSRTEHETTYIHRRMSG